MSHVVDAPNVLKKELTQLLAIQNEFETLEKTVKLASASIKKGVLPKASLDHLNVMIDQLGTIRERADAMYSTLNVDSNFPSLAGVELEFVRRLFLLRQLKATVQKKATSTMWEFDKLDQASGGKDMALGKTYCRRLPITILTLSLRYEDAPARSWRNVQEKYSLNISRCSI